MTDFTTLAENRYSVREFSPEPIKQEEMDKILHTAMIAPTACNLQPFKIVVIDDEEGRRKLRMCTSCHFDAPNAVLVFYDKTQCWKRSYDGKTSGDIDAAIVTTHMMLAAAELGVGTTWVMYFIPEAIMTEFSVPDNYEPVALLVMGYPSKNASPGVGHFKSKATEDVVSYNEIK